MRSRRLGFALGAWQGWITGPDATHSHTHTHKHARTHQALFQKQHFLAPSIPATCLNKQTGSWRTGKNSPVQELDYLRLLSIKRAKEGGGGCFGFVRKFLHLLVRLDTYHTTVTAEAISGNGNKNLARQEKFRSACEVFPHPSVSLAWIL